MSDSTTIVMLSADSHRAWKDRIEAEALMVDAYGILDGTDACPTGTSADQVKAIKEWNKAKNKIAGIILKTLDHAHKALIAGITISDAKAVWDKLNQHYESKDAVRVKAISRE